MSENIEEIKEIVKKKFKENPDANPREIGVYIGKIIWYHKKAKFVYDSWLIFDETFKIYNEDEQESLAYGYFDENDKFLVRIKGKLSSISFWDFVQLLLKRKKVRVY